MTVSADRWGAGTADHRDLQALRAALSPHDVWWTLPALAGLTSLEADLMGRVSVHRMVGRMWLTVRELKAADLRQLQALSPYAYVNRPDALCSDRESADLSQLLAESGCKVFFGHGARTSAGVRLGRHSRIGTLEFLFSDEHRLARYPVLSAHRFRSDGPAPGGRTVAVVVLDLIQDFEVLRPLMVQAAASGSPFELRVAVTERVVKSLGWLKIQQFMDIFGIAHFTPVGPVDVQAALGSRKSLLLTASESSAAAHTFGHAVCRIAPPRAIRVTVQHGLECIGLRHHRAHDLDFPNGVRFASDIILTWDGADSLPQLHPAERDKCVPVGVLKAMAELAAQLQELDWHTTVQEPPRSGPRRLLIAENLHSVRFRAPARHQRFLGFIRAAQAHPAIDLTIRSHPASRTLEKDSGRNKLKFLDDELRADDLRRFDAFVSPPSTILLDAVMAGVPTLVWTDSAFFGDAAGYAGLQVATDLPDWLEHSGGGRNCRLSDMSWALASTAALHGTPAAWNTLTNLFG